MEAGVWTYHLPPSPPDEIDFPELVALAEDSDSGESAPIFEPEPAAFDPGFIPPPDEGAPDPELAAQMWALSAGQQPPAQQADSGVSPLDADPGPVLAASLERTRLDALDEDGLLSVVQAWHRIGAWATARECAAVTAFMNRTRPGNPQASDSAVAQLELALTLTAAGSGRLLELTSELERLPGLRHCLETGAIDEFKSRVIAQGTSILGIDAARRVEEQVLPKAPEQTSGQLRAAVARAVISADPDAAERRRKKAEKRQRIEVRPTSDHTADLCARDLPADEALAANARIAAIARALKSDGQPGTLQYLRARVFTGLLLGTGPGTGTAPASPEPGPGPNGSDPGRPGTGRPGTGRPGTGRPGTSGPGLPGDVCPPRASEGTHHAEPANTGGRAAAGVPYGLNLTVPLATLLGQSGEPGQIPAYGPVPAAMARTIATRARGRWCVTFLDSSGRAARHGHIKPRAGPGNPESPYGTAVHVTVPAGDLPGPADHWPPSANHFRWILAAIKKESATKPDTYNIGDGLERCTHPEGHVKDSYRPARTLRHWIEIRDQTCRFPGCRTASYRCDIDHTNAYHQSRRTCSCNLSPLCRKHHMIKQIQGWKLFHPQPRILTWTTPAGRKYTATPDPYA